MFNEKINEIGFRRKNILVLPFEENKESELLKINKNYLLGALLKELENLGYGIDKETYDYLSSVSDNDLKTVHKFLIKNICELKGNMGYKPFYPNFPEQVEQANSFELFVNAFVHYWSYGEWQPTFKTELRDKLKGDYKLEIIHLGNNKDLINIAENLFNSKLVYSQTDKSDLSMLIETFNKSLNLPDKITNKENLIFIIEEYRKNGLDLSKLFKTSTDILRYSIALQDGDISLSEQHKFKAINRPTRRFLLNLLNNINNPLEDMYRHRDKWLRLSEKLHPFDYKIQYNKAFENICYIRNNVRYKESFNHYVHEYLQNKDFEKLCEHLSKRPSEFARRLNEVLQSANSIEKEFVLQSFEKVADKVSSNVLISVYNFFNNMNNLTNRFFVLKGLRAKTHAIDNELSLSKKYIDKVLDICQNSLINTFKDKKELTKVFIDKDIESINIPNQNRTSSTSFKSLTKGSRIKLDSDKDIVRMFCYWKNQNGNHTDVDLSALIFKDGFKEKEHISYTRLRSNSYYAVHSGDITNAPNGASEYIDLSISEMLNCGYRYVMISINMFDGVPFSQMDVCGAGFMLREDKQSGEIYDPLTVKQHYKVQTEGMVSCPFIIDLENREMIWVDMNLSGRISCNAVENNSDTQSLIAKNITEKNDMSLRQLIILNCIARSEYYNCDSILIDGELNEDILNCDVIYTLDKELVLEKLKSKLSEDEVNKKQIITIYDIDVLLGDLM